MIKIPVTQATLQIKISDIVSKCRKVEILGHVTIPEIEQKIKSILSDTPINSIKVIESNSDFIEIEVKEEIFEKPLVDILSEKVDNKLYYYRGVFMLKG